MPSRWVALLGFSLLATRVDAESWTSVFAAERDTAVFLGTDGTLFRAPLNLEAREVLWAGRPDQHVVRFVVSPVGRRIAWIARGFNEDTTRLWVCGANGPEQRLRYFALLPRRHGFVHSEPDVPTLADPNVGGGRLVQAGAPMLRPAANTLEWASDGRTVVLGYDGGIASLAADVRSNSGLTGVVAVELNALRPSPALLASVLPVESPTDWRPVTDFDLAHLFISHLDVHQGRKVDPSGLARVIMSPTTSGWRMCTVPAWASAKVRAVGPRTLWWAKGRGIYSMAVGDSAASEAMRAPVDIVWLGYGDAHGELLGAAGEELWRMPETGGAPTAIARAGSRIRAVLTSRTSSSIALSTRDTLLVWNPETNVVRRFRSRGFEPCALFESPEGRIVVQVDCGPGLPRRLARGDSLSASLVPIETPIEREGAFQAFGRGAWILLFDPGPKPPRRLHAYDMALDRWRSVENPGITAWEPLK